MAKGRDFCIVRRVLSWHKKGARAGRNSAEKPVLPTQQRVLTAGMCASIKKQRIAAADTKQNICRKTKRKFPKAEETNAKPVQMKRRQDNRKHKKKTENEWK